MIMRKRPENLLKKLQNFSQKVTQSPTALMPKSLLQRTHQSKDKESLHGWILALETPTLSKKNSIKVQEPSRFHAALKKSEETLTTTKNPRMQKSTDQGISEGGKGKESGTEPVLFNFGDGYCDGVNWVSVERTLFMENFKTIRIPAFVNEGSVSTATEDIKYSRDDVFKLSSQEDTMKEFFREKIF